MKYSADTECEISPFGRCEMKFAFFILAKQIFHSTAISHGKAIFYSPKANFIAPQFIQEITKKGSADAKPFCKFRPLVEIISWRTVRALKKYAGGIFLAR